MDELDISGKRYISSKRAAKDNRYHVDYIGQLIRAGKIVGSKVGRTWYVEAESLAHYLDQDYKAPSTPAAAPENYVPTARAEVKVQKPSSAESSGRLHRIEEEEVVVESLRAPLQHITINKVRDEEEEQEIESPKPVSRIAHTGMSGLRYIADDEPLLPPVARRERSVEVHKAAADPQETQAPARARTAMQPRAAVTLRTPYSSQQRKVLMLAAGVLGVVAFCGALSLSYFLKADTTVEAANTYSSLHF